MVAAGVIDMKATAVLPLVAGVAFSLVLSAPSFAGSVSAGRLVSISRPVSYSPARPSYAGAAAKPGAASRASTSSAPATMSRTSAPVASAAPTTSSPARQESSSGSFWTPFVLGYMMAPSGGHAASSTPKPASPAQANAAPSQVPSPAAADPKARTGPFAIDVPESELLDGDCKIRTAAQEFIKGAKIDHSVVFLATPESGRCGKLRERLAGQVSPAILVKSETDHIVLSRMMKQ